MAKLHSYYVICPLIDQKSFLGASRDREDTNIIVTLSRNIVNKYRLSDQKQIGGWTSKEHITSQVIFDHESESYAGVFNNNVIKSFKDDTENLEKLKKYKFSHPILQLIPRANQSSLIVFTNGNTVSLQHGIENRKDIQAKAVLKANETILDINTYTFGNVDFICFVIRNKDDKYEIVSCPLRNEIGDLEKVKMERVKVERDEHDVYIVGKFISIDHDPVVYILWSDSKMTVYDLARKSWRTIGTVPWISTLSSISMAWMGDNHLILYGNTVDQDGAIIVAYNTALGVGSCRYPMKMYTENSKLYCFNNRIILEASNHIGMLPYAVETSRSIASLLGSHEVILDDKTEIADWGSNIKPQNIQNNELKDLLEIGLPERSVCLQVLPQLIEKSTDHIRIGKLLTTLNDIPESILVQLITFAITKLIKMNELDITDRNAFREFCDNDKYRSKLDFFNSLLFMPFSDALLISQLRNGLSLDNALILLKYITYLIVESDIDFNVDIESKLFDWCTLVMDAFYQQFLMTKDDKVTYILELTRSIVDDHVSNMMIIDSSLPMLNKLVKGKWSQENEDKFSYSIELMQI